MSERRRYRQGTSASLLVFALMMACAKDPTGPNANWGTTISGEWIAETETAALTFEIGWFGEFCYLSSFGGTVCTARATVTGSITSNGQTSEIMGTASTPAPSYDAIDFTPVTPVEKAGTDCLVDKYYAIVKPVSQGLSAQLVSYCSSVGRDLSTRNQILIMRRP